LESKKNGKKSSVVTGAVQLQFSVIDPSNQNATPQETIQKLFTLIGASSADSAEGDDSPEAEEQDGDHVEPGASGDQAGAAGTAEKKKKRRLKIAKLKRKAKERGYEFTGSSSIAGVLFVEIQRITDLPPERNGKFTSTSLDAEADAAKLLELASIWTLSSSLR